MIKKHLILSLLITFFASCDDSENSSSLCDNITNIDGARYTEVIETSSEKNISDATISGDCLEITFNGSGCDGSTWLVELIDSESIRKPLPAERDVVLFLDNSEECEALIQKTESFDLSNLKIEGESEIRIYLFNYDEPLFYSY